MSASDGSSAIPEAGEGRRGPDGYLGYLLRQAAAAYRRSLDRALSDLGVTQPQFVVMTMLKAYPGQSNADIARVAALTPQTINVIVANLEKAGHVERRDHEAHGRIRQIHLTSSGLDLLRDCRSRVQAVEDETARTVSDDDLGALRRSLIAIARMSAR